jgi:hypothetical protein
MELKNTNQIEGTYESIVMYMADFNQFKENPDLFEVAKLLLKNTIIGRTINRSVLKTNVIQFMVSNTGLKYSINIEDYVFKHDHETENRSKIGKLINKVRINNSISKQMFVLIFELEKCTLDLSDETKGTVFV